MSGNHTGLRELGQIFSAFHDGARIMQMKAASSQMWASAVAAATCLRHITTKHAGEKRKSNIKQCPRFTHPSKMWWK